MSNLLKKEHFEHIKTNKPFDICYTLEEMKYNLKGYGIGSIRNQLQLAVKDINSDKYCQ